MVAKLDIRKQQTIGLTLCEFPLERKPARCLAASFFSATFKMLIPIELRLSGLEQYLWHPISKEAR